MKRSLILFPLLCAALLAQSSQTIPFRALMSPRNEVPPIDSTATGIATVWVHVMRDSAGQIVSGSVDFDVSYTMPGATTFTGLHIHEAAAGVNGPVRIDTGITAASPVADETGRGRIQRQAQVLPTSATGVAALRGLLENPAGYYVNLHTTTNTGGLIRGQLMPADWQVFAAQMSPANEVPPIAGLDASGIGTVQLLTTRDAQGRVNSASAVFEVQYRGFPEGTRLQGLHIHAGAAGANGGVTLDSGLGTANAITVPANGSGAVRLENEINLTANAVTTLDNIGFTPRNYYLNLHTNVNTGGAIRGQAVALDRSEFQVRMLPSNEFPPITGLDAAGQGGVTLHTLRDSSGAVVAGVVVFDVNYRFPGETTFTGLHVHNGAAGVNGPVRWDTGITSANPVQSATGFGNIFRVATISSEAGLAALTSAVANPELHYLNLHTTVNGGGAVRGQLAAANAVNPFVIDVLSGVSDPALRTVAQAGLMTIFGSDLAKVPTNLAGLSGSSYPTSVNGSSVTIGGIAAPIIAIGREPQFTPSDYMVVQVPNEAPAGMHPVIVRNSNGGSNTVMVRVASTAPGIYFDREGGIAFRARDMALIRAGEAARVGDVLWVLTTGLGGTTPTIATGAFAPSSPVATASNVTVTVGGTAQSVQRALAVPGVAGLYLVEFTLAAPTTAPSGATVPVVVRVGDGTSNTVNIAYRP
ncbi:MAG: CHRD domain-containing protein [Bryobacteraceae bacterium]|nr:CHRD domain-containing protein [Bryobacteraceae bacterium]